MKNRFQQALESQRAFQGQFQPPAHNTPQAVSQRPAAPVAPAPPKMPAPATDFFQRQPGNPAAATGGQMKFIASQRGVAVPEALDFEEELRPRKGLFSRLGEALNNLIFEEDERPVGISQLSRQTFQPAPGIEKGVFFGNRPVYNDYRFRNIVEDGHGLR